MGDTEVENRELRVLVDSFAPFLDSLKEAIAIIDTHGTFIYYNKESAVLDGCSQSFALGKRITEVYPSMSADESTMLHALSGKVYIENHTNYFNAKGELVNYKHTTMPVRAENGAIIGAIEIGYDLSKDTKLNNQLYLLNKRLFNRTQGRSEKTAEEKIVTRSVLLKEVIAKAKQYAQTEVPVIIYGESGTGKELFANLIYENSQRNGKPFVVLNCGALSENLIESSLFGTVKGAFTGAENNEGFLAMADGGTLFLDEFNSMPLPMQVKLLRFLQSKTYCRVGSSKEKKSDARIVVAMNERPETLIEQGRLRADLYWRLNVAYLELPPLRDRPEDIEPLAQHFIEKHADEVPNIIHGLSKGIVSALRKCTWPGNVRMLENVIVRSMVLQGHDGELEEIIGDLENTERLKMSADAQREEPERMKSTSQVVEDFETGLPLEDLVEQYEKALIIKAINVCGGNTSSAANMLKMKRTTLCYKIKKYGLKMGVQNPDA